MAIVATACLGYPRIGERREWKKALEAFWKGNTDETAFLDAMREIRIKRLLRQKRAGIVWIPSGDFSFYDSMLDHMAAFNLVPDRFRRLGPPDSLAVYFAMARGAEDAPACEMTKWFDTNYHYLVPELDGAAEPKLVFNPWREAFAEAKAAAGLHTRPVLIGPYTFVRLSRGVPEDRFRDAVRALLPAYAAALAELAAAGATWVQLDEPALVTDVSDAHLPLLEEAYTALRAAAPGLQARRRIPWGCAMPVPPPLARGVLSTQRLSVRAGTAACTYRAHSAYADPAAEKAKVYALPLYAESAPCNRKSHPACMRGGQSANTLQTRCKQQAPESPPQTIPGNRAEIEKMPALKGFRRCPSVHQMHQLTSYAD